MTDTQPDGPRSRAEWAEIRARIEALGREIAAGVRISPEEADALLRARARSLAAPPPAEKRETGEFVVFEVESETYAVESRFVLEVLRGAEVAWIPGVEPPALGIAAWRGELLVLLDTRRLLGRSGLPVADGAPILVLGEEQAAFGLPVDAVEGLREIAPSSILPLSGEVASRGAPLAGITSDAVLVLASAELIRTQTRGD